MDCVGTCSLCGGRVMRFGGPWCSILPPPPGRCESCNAVEAQHGPVVQMRPAPRYQPPAQPFVPFGPSDFGITWQVVPSEILLKDGEQ